MANKKSNADIDLEDMSMEQLEEHIKAENADLSSNPTIDTKDEDITAVEEEPETESAEDEAVDTEAEETSEEVDDDEPALIRGKSRADIVRMWNDSQKMISKQGNDKHEIMTKLTALEAKVNTPAIQEKKDELMEELGNYKPEDINVINKLVDRRLDDNSKSQKEASEKTLKVNTDANETFWTNLEIIDPVLSVEIKKDILGAIAKDKPNTLQKAGWLQSYVANYKATKSGVKTPKPNLTTKKLKAKTAGQGSQSTQKKKTVKDMSAEEYADSVGLKRA